MHYDPHQIMSGCSMLRTCLFWIHLVCGLTVGVVVFTMSLTGVLLTYERQIEHWAASLDYVPVASHTVPLPLEMLLLKQQQARPELQVSTLTLTNHPGAPVELRAGRTAGVNLNPYTGELMEVGSPALGNAFGALTRFHRWFSVEGDNRTLARQITGISNLGFLFLVLSGLYLWLPSLWKWGIFKARLLLRKDYPDSKSRNYHWHHIFGMWAALPLLAVVYSGAVISYPWAANAMYTVFGAELPAQGVAARPAPNSGSSENSREMHHGRPASAAPASALPLKVLIDAALAHSGEGWNRINLGLPSQDATQVQIEIDKGNGAQAHKRHTLTLDRSGAKILSVTAFSDTPKAQQLRGIARFLHTGEVLGFWGQTLAGLASLAALFLVWTGFSLSWRRLIQPAPRH